MKLNHQETRMVIQALREYVDIMGEGEDTSEYTNYMMENGLGSAMRKIAKGLNWETPYKKYTCHRESHNYPTFEEWTASRKRNGAKRLDDDE